MNMVFTKKMSVCSTRSKKSTRQVQSAEEAGLTQVRKYHEEKISMMTIKSLKAESKRLNRRRIIPNFATIMVGAMIIQLTTASANRGLWGFLFGSSSKQAGQALTKAQLKEIKEFQKGGGSHPAQKAF